MSWMLTTFSTQPTMSHPSYPHSLNGKWSFLSMSGSPVPHFSQLFIYSISSPILPQRLSPTVQRLIGQFGHLLGRAGTCREPFSVGMTTGSRSGEITYVSTKSISSIKKKKRGGVVKKCSIGWKLLTYICSTNVQLLLHETLHGKKAV